MKRIFSIIIFIVAAIFCFSPFTLAQLKTRKPVKKTATKKKATPEPTPPTASVENQTAETVSEKTPVKKNERLEKPAESVENQQSQESPQKKNQSPKSSNGGTQSEESKNVFSYEFTQPDFTVSHIVIKHDETGKGTITFEKRNLGDAVTDPIQLSNVSLERIKNLFQTLNFIDSTEDYQSSARQYPHLGTAKIGLKSGGRGRMVQFNWTENKDARALADEYRKIGEQFVWMFDISLALENQPLEAPGLMAELDSLIKRDEISDPAQMIPLLKKLADDERIPLIARNHAARIIKEIEKKANGK